MQDRAEIKKEIEKLRSELYREINRNNKLSCKEILKISNRLDNSIKRYYQLLAQRH